MRGVRRWTFSATTEDLLLHLAQAGCKVAGVDSSRPALEVADRNAVLNGREIEWVEGNAFDVLRDYAKSGQRYDTRGARSSGVCQEQA